uniref:Uncharacterized protein n=1 Tax=Streptomyces sp. NBC_00180 TaxID=2903632 RepID=A0AAU1IAV1_9ACTN
MDESQSAVAEPTRFVRFLRERGYAFSSEPGLATASGPGCLISAAGHTVACAVMTVEQTFNLYAFLDGFEETADRLGSLRNQGLPLVVVVESDPDSLFFPTPGDRLLDTLLHGDVPRELYDDPPQSSWSPRGDERPERRLVDAHPHISAVAVVVHNSHAHQWLRDRFEARPESFDSTREGMDAMVAEILEAPQGGSLSLHIFETLGGTALLLPREVFDGPMDRRWIPNTDRTRLLPPDES